MSSSASEELLFFALVINGSLAGAIYALIALAFVLVYKASRMINFALGEWIMFGSLLASTGSHTIGLDLGGAVLFGCVGMALLGVAFNAIVLGRLVMRPVISLIMVTLGLGALMRGVAALCFRGVPGAMTLPVSTDPVSFCGIERGLVVHKLLEEVLTGETADHADALEIRARVLLAELGISEAARPEEGPHAPELAATTLRALGMPEIAACRSRLVPEMCDGLQVARSVPL